jgi:probable HAF family extracellular repeat protein
LLQNGSVTDLGTLGGAYTTPLAINKRGQVVGFSSTTTNSGQPFLWQDGSMTALGFLPGGTYGGVDALNDRGQLVGYSQGPPPTFGNHLVLWERQIRDLGLPEGFTYVEPSAINNRGDIMESRSRRRRRYLRACLGLPRRSVHDARLVPSPGERDLATHADRNQRPRRHSS